MKLTYRGINYEYEAPALDMNEGKFAGKYRGINCQLGRYPRHIPVPQPPLDLKYRGIAYSTHQTVEPELIPTKAQPQVRETITITSSLKTHRDLKQELAKVHCQSITRQMEHRLQVAKAKGDRDLIDQLEKEAASCCAVR